MIKLYLEKRKNYEEKIADDLKKINDNVEDIAQIGDYFSIKHEDTLITIKAVLYDDEKTIAIKSEDMADFIPLNQLKLTDHPDLILWAIQNTKLIEQGFIEVLINAVRNGENIINTLKELNPNYE